MLYEYNGKVYVKPFVNKIVEVKLVKRDDKLDIEPTTKILDLTSEIKKEMVSITFEEAVKKLSKLDKKSLSNI